MFERETMIRLDEIAVLPPNWDSYGGETPWPENVAIARRLALLFGQPPAVVPTSRGGVQLEWHGHGFDVEVYVHVDDTADDGPVTVALEMLPVPVERSDRAPVDEVGGRSSVPETE